MAFMPKIPFVSYPLEFYGTMPESVIVTKVTLGVSYSQYKDALMLVEGTIEDLEKIDGCSFSPSMAYLRSQIEAANI